MSHSHKYLSIMIDVASLHRDMVMFAYIRCQFTIFTFLKSDYHGIKSKRITQKLSDITKTVPKPVMFTTSRHSRNSDIMHEP